MTFVNRMGLPRILNIAALVLMAATTGLQAEYLLPPEDEQFRAIFLPLYHTTMSSQVNAKVQRIFKRMGDSFEEGEILIQQENQVYKGLLEKARAAVARTEAELKGRQDLFSKNLISYFDLKTAEANLASAQSEFVTAETLYNSCAIRAPYKGKVINLFVEEQEYVQEGRNLIEIIYDEVLLGRLLVPTKDLKQFTRGKELKIKIPEAGTIVEGKVYRIDAAINPSSSLIKVDIIVLNHDQKLISGMIGEVIVEPKRVLREEPVPINPRSEPNRTPPKVKDGLQQNSPTNTLQNKNERK